MQVVRAVRGEVTVALAGAGVFGPAGAVHAVPRVEKAISRGRVFIAGPWSFAKGQLFFEGRLAGGRRGVDRALGGLA